MRQHVLILGPVGVGKKLALSNLESYSNQQPYSPLLMRFDLEKDFIFPSNHITEYGYFDSQKDMQKIYWENGWRSFYENHVAKSDGDNATVCLSLHAVITRPLYGTRSPINLQSLLSFRPDIIVTLIDDVYLMYSRTEARASGLGYRGRPTLEQLLDARRTEIFLGDFIASHVAPSARHYVLAIQHPARTLYRLMFGRNLRRIYLSFPITGPRALLLQGDSSGIEEVNSFLRLADDFESRNPHIACFCPLAIDEFPLLEAIKECETSQLEFKTANRWHISDFCKEPLLVGDMPETIQIPKEYVSRAAGLIRSDVRLRDYRLVDQSDALAVFNPWFNGKRANGVRNEIALALRHCIPVHIFQDPKHDPENEAMKTLKKEEGSLGDEPGSEYLTFYKRPQDLFQAALNG